MMNLFEMMQSAQNGQAMQNLARQYGLSQQQTQSAIEALLPAFSMGLQRQTQDPQAFGSLAQMMTASPFGNIFDARGAIPPTATTAGNDVLSQLFGSKEVSQAVAAQAAATSGVSQAILKQMLPIIASMVMGGLVKSTSNQGLGGILGQFAEMMRGQMAGQQPAPAPQQQAPANPLDTIFGGMFGNAAAPNPGQAPGGSAGAQPGINPFDGGMLGQILTGMLGGAQQPDTRAAPPAPTSRPAEPEEEEAPPPPSAPGPGSIGLDALNQMFEHGRQVQDDHQNALKSILDSMLGGGQSRR